MIDPLLAPYPAAVRWAAWAAYWWLQGIVCTGLWVIAHDAGHEGFSDYQTLNHTVGYILHTALLVPFFSWRRTHATHHKYTNHCTKDQVFVPYNRKNWLRNKGVSAEDYDAMKDHSAFEDAPLYVVLRIGLMLLLGWPLYLITNATGQDHGKWTNHFFPSADIFASRDYWYVVLSDVGLIGMFYLLYQASTIYGFDTLVKFYVIPYLLVNMWLVLITFLQHTDPRLPHYRQSSFTFIRGALATIDRDFGGFLNYFLHNINDTHIAHHLFSQMPHYHATEATAAIRKVLGPCYLFDNSPIAKSVYKSYSSCQYIEDEGDVVFFKRANGNFARL